jgi:hypothetical protein
VLSVIQWSEEELQSCGADRQAELEPSTRAQPK